MEFTEPSLKRLLEIDRERISLSLAAAVLRWDQETYMPSGAVEERADQLALLEGLAHEKLVSPETGTLLEKLGVLDAPDGSTESDFLKILARDYGKAVKLPSDFVRESARAEGLSQAAWARARTGNDFAAFAPHLKKMLEYARKKAKYWGYGENAYDGLLDSFEPGMGEAELDAVFAPLKEGLLALLNKISARQNDTDFLHCHYDIKEQDAFNRELMAGLGFDLKRGRLDVSAHPFTTTLGFNDVRITTRYAADDPMSGIFSVIHESGHAFYELSLDPGLRGSCLAGGTSMGIHESQSRLWENVLGKSRAFWEGWFPVLKNRFPVQLANTGVSVFYRAINAAAPGFIRTEADEIRYSLHIILRFELERRLLAGTLTVDTVPAAWNDAMEALFGVRPPDDASGVLQDVHWSMGAFGYFPSYALGNLYALHFMKKLKADIPELDTLLARRGYDDIHRWLGEKVHRFGRRRDPAEILMYAAGETLSPAPFLDYLETKYADIYGF